MNHRLWDHGLQNERTTLSWRRTGLGLFGCGVLAARSWMLDTAHVAGSLAGGTGLVAAAAMTVVTTLVGVVALVGVMRG